MADASGRADRNGLAVAHSQHVVLRAHLDATTGTDTAIRIDDGMERDRLVQAVLDGVAAGVRRPALAPAVAQDDGNDG
jgi:hypothetical protein